MGNAYSKPPVLVRRWLKPSKKVDEPRKLLQSVQLGFDRQLAEQYGTIEKMKYGDCLLEEDEEMKDTFRIMWYLEDEKRVISKNHSMWDKYNLMAIEHVQELGLHIKTLSCIARKVVIVRARILQCLCVDEYCTRDYQIYDHLIDNWSVDITIDILLLHRYKDRPLFRQCETHVLTWIASKMDNPPEIR